MLQIRACSFNKKNPPSVTVIYYGFFLKQRRIQNPVSLRLNVSQKWFFILNVQQGSEHASVDYLFTFLKMGRGVYVEMGGCSFFINLQFIHIYSLCGKSKFSFITFQFFSLLSQSCMILIQVFLVLKHYIICLFLNHSGSVQKIYLLKLVLNTQKQSSRGVL